MRNIPGVIWHQTQMFPDHRRTISLSEEIEGRVTKKLSQEFSRTENPILGALARLDDFLMNPLLQGHSGTTPEAFRNVFSINQGTNEDDSQSNPHPEAGLLTSVREDRHDLVTVVQRESVEDRDTAGFADLLRQVELTKCHYFSCLVNTHIVFLLKSV